MTAAKRTGRPHGGEAPRRPAATYTDQGTSKSDKSGIWIDGDTIHFDLKGVPEGYFSNNGATDEDVLRDWILREPTPEGEQDARCPLHDDRTASASINFRKSVWHCFKGCPDGHIGELLYRMAFGTSGTPPKVRRLEPAKYEELSEAKVEGWHGWLISHDEPLDRLREQRGVTLETVERFRVGYDKDNRRYTFPVYDENGTLVNVRRYRLGASGRAAKWLNTPGHGSPVRLYPSASELPVEGRVFVVEGELDALLLWQAGIPAFTCTGGAGMLAKVIAEHANLFEGLGVVVWTDHDEAGRKAQAAVAEVLRDRARVQVLEPFASQPEDGQDVTDYWRQEGWQFAEQVDRLVRLTSEEDDEPRSSWAPVSLADYMRGDVEADPPTILRREDGEHLLYEGKLQSLAGESESAKTWLALIACVELLEQERHVLFIDFEDDARSIATRLAALGVDPERVDGFFHYLRPDDPLTTETAQRALERTLQAVPVELTVIDGVTEVMTLHGWDPLSNADTARFIQLLPRPLVRAGSAVLLLDHLPLNNAGRRHAIGGQHKLAALTGTGLRIDVMKGHPFGRGMEGRFLVKVTKDKGGGFVRALGVGERHDVAVLHLFSDAETGQVTYSLEPPARSTAPSGRVSMETDGVTQEDASPFYPNLIKYLRGQGPTSQNDLVKVKGLLKGTKKKRIAILAVAVEDEDCPIAVRGSGGNDDPLTYYLDGEA